MLLSNIWRIFKHEEGAYEGAATLRFKLLKADPCHLDEGVLGFGVDDIDDFKVIFGGGGDETAGVGGDMTRSGATYGLGPGWLIEFQLTSGIHCHTLCSSPKIT